MPYEEIFQSICKQKGFEPQVEDMLLAWFQNILHFEPNEFCLFEDTRDCFIMRHLNGLKYVNRISIVSPLEYLNGEGETSEILRSRIVNDKNVLGFRLSRDGEKYILDEQGELVFPTGGFTDKSQLAIVLFENSISPMFSIFHHELQHIIQKFVSFEFPVYWIGEKFLREGDAYYRQFELFLPEWLSQVFEISDDDEYSLYSKLYYFLMGTISKNRRNLWFQEGIEKMLGSMTYMEQDEFSENFHSVLIALMKYQNFSNEDILKEVHRMIEEYNKNSQVFTAFLLVTYQKIQYSLRINQSFERIMRMIDFKLRRMIYKSKQSKFVKNEELVQLERKR